MEIKINKVLFCWVCSAWLELYSSSSSLLPIIDAIHQPHYYCSLILKRRKYSKSLRLYLSPKIMIIDPIKFIFYRFGQVKVAGSVMALVFIIIINQKGKNSAASSSNPFFSLNHVAWLGIMAFYCKNLSPDFDFFFWKSSWLSASSSLPITPSVLVLQNKRLQTWSSSE